MKNFKKHSGFTLIELVVVIAILGILAAFAIPRFASLEREARVGTVLGAAGSVRSAATLAHSLFLVQGTTPIVMEGVSINLTEGYPDAPNRAGFPSAVLRPGEEYHHVMVHRFSTV